ncbi:hypothetical protein KSP39_PZI023526 [Platanthera zijinensis]|uniref:Leucine--tRNA ligase RagD-binding domain-containing protein n=1 Tax=Platanthera zijinensis TaxID=2320716 RepID=A0AAP0FTY9_9ASPA
MTLFAGWRRAERREAIGAVVASPEILQQQGGNLKQFDGAFFLSGLHLIYLGSDRLSVHAPDFPSSAISNFNNFSYMSTLCRVCVVFLLRKDGFVVNAGWPCADSPDLTLQRANKYLQDSIILMRKLLQKQISGPKKSKKGDSFSQSEESMLTDCLIYVDEQYDGWKEECLKILQRKFDRENGSFKSEKEILQELKESPLGNDMKMKQIQKLCMSFLKFKMDDVLHVGVQALDLKLHFDEIEVLKENADLIRRQLCLDHVEILSASDEVSRKKAGPHITLLTQNPPLPGNPVSIFSNYNRDRKGGAIKKKPKKRNRSCRRSDSAVVGDSDVFSFFTGTAACSARLKPGLPDWISAPPPSGTTAGSRPPGQAWSDVDPTGSDRMPPPLALP